MRSPSGFDSRDNFDALYEITHAPSFSMLRMDLMPDTAVIAEAGSMVARDSHVQMRTRLSFSPEAGVFAWVKVFFVALLRKILGGETFVLTQYRAAMPGRVWLAPPLAGQIAHRRLEGETLILSAGSYLAHTGDIRLRLRFGGLKSVLARRGPFFLELTGHGDLFFANYGAMQCIEVNAPFSLDNGHLVAYEGELSFEIRTAGGGFLGLLASGEGLVCEFSGTGKVYVQTRNVGSLVGWVSRLLPS